MTPGAWAVWPPFLLLLLWLPGCFPLSSLSPMTGYVGRALSVQCQYEEDHRLYSKYWCRESMLGVRCNKIVETEVSKRELRKDRVSITDHPTNLTFKVTLEHLTLEDAGAYRCGINLPWSKDLEFQVVVYVLPTPTSRTSTIVTTAKTLTTRTEVQATLSTSSAAKSPTQGSSPEERPRDFQGQSIWPLLSVLALLLLLLMGASLLAWWRIQKRIKADKHPELSQNLRQAAEQSDPQYVNLQLHMLSLREEPVPPRQVDTEYSTVTLPKDDLHYASVVFDSQKPTCNASEDPTRGSQGGEPEYSVIRKPTAGPSDPHQRLL